MSVVYVLVVCWKVGSKGENYASRAGQWKCGSCYVRFVTVVNIHIAQDYIGDVAQAQPSLIGFGKHAFLDDDIGFQPSAFGRFLEVANNKTIEVMIRGFIQQYTDTGSIALHYDSMARITSEDDHFASLARRDNIEAIF